MRWVFRVVSVLVAAAMVAVFGSLLIPADKVAEAAASRFQAATGRALTIEGAARPSLWPELGISTGAVTVANADWSDAGPLMTAERLSIGVDLMALVRGDIRITTLTAEAPSLLLERAADGAVNWAMNWAMADTGATGDTSEAPRTVTLDNARITGATIRYVDHAAGTETRLDAVDLSLALPDLAAPATLEASGTWRNAPLSVSAEVGAPAAFLAGETVSLTLQAELGGAVLSFDGRVASTAAAEGRFDLGTPDIPALLALVGADAGYPVALGRSGAAVGDLTLTGETLNLRKTRLTLGEQRVEVIADLALADRPRLVARIDAGDLDLSALAGEGGAPAASGWSTEPIDVSALQTIDGELLLNAASLTLGSTRIDGLSTLTRLDEGRAVTDLRGFQVYGGALAGSVVVNSRGGLSLRTNLTGTGLSMQSLLSDVAGFDRLSASMNGTLNLLGSGNSVAALMAGLSGDGRLAIGAGTLEGVDLAATVRNRRIAPRSESTGARTVFDSINASFTIAGGVLSNQDLAISAPRFEAEGRGTVSLGPQTLDYTVIPTLRDDQRLVLPITITGAWAAPAFGLDVGSAIEETLRGGAERLRDETGGTLRDRLGGETGTDGTRSGPLRNLLGGN